MGRLIYAVIVSVDGYIADADGQFEWAEPDEEVIRFVNVQERGIGTHLYGRRMYEEMAAWETMQTEPGSPEEDFATMWRAADKIVFSRTLEAVSTPRTRLERELTPAVVAEIKAGTDHDVSISGPTLAASAITAGLVDEVQVYLTPVAVGGGTPFMPLGARVGLSLVDVRRFQGGVMHLRYVTG